MYFWTTDHISHNNKIFTLYKENPKPKVGYNKEFLVAQILYHEHRSKDDVVYWACAYADGKNLKETFYTLEDAKEWVEDIFDLENEDVANSDFDLDFVKPFKRRGYYRPHELGLP